MNIFRQDVAQPGDYYGLVYKGSLLVPLISIVLVVGAIIIVVISKRRRQKNNTP